MIIESYNMNFNAKHHFQTVAAIERMISSALKAFEYSGSQNLEIFL